MIEISLVIATLIAVVYASKRYFDYKDDALEKNQDNVDALTEKLSTLTEEMATLSSRTSAYEQRMDAILKTFLVDIRETVKFQQKQVQESQQKALNIATRR